MLLIKAIFFPVLGIFVEASGYRSRRYELMWPSPPTNVGKLKKKKSSYLCRTENQ